MTSEPPPVNHVERDNSIIVLKICGIILTVCAIGAVSAALRTVIPPMLLGLLLYFLVSPVIENGRKNGLRMPEVALEPHNWCS